MSDKPMKIVEAMFRLMPEGPRMIPYEDIVVKAWEMYPQDFGLRGYADKHPDSSDIHKRLYGTLKEQGWVKSGATGRKQFTLTESGWERAASQLGTRSGVPTDGASRMSRTTEQEIHYLVRTDAARLFSESKGDEILDSDFFSFYRTSVRASPQDFEGRLAQVESALAEASSVGASEAGPLSALDSYLRKRFSSLIARKSERRKR